jgi:eukaryotic-like serine/threonine-protein kinase
MPELCLKIVSDPPLSLAKLRPAVPPSLVEIVERCLEKDRNKRYTNAAELAVALAPFVPPRNSVYSLGPPGALEGSPPPGSLFMPPIQVSGGPGPNPSIPAAWGTEGRRESQQAPPRRRQVLAWVVFSSLAVAAAIVAVVLNRPGAVKEGSPAASNPPPPVTDIASAIPEAIHPAAEVPAAAESVAAAAVPEPPTAEPSIQAAPPRGVPSMQWPPRNVRSAAAPSAVGGALAKPDDDIPSLR